jgi:hypothetical protein
MFPFPEGSVEEGQELPGRRLAKVVAGVRIDVVSIVTGFRELAHAVAAGHEVTDVACTVFVKVRLVGVRALGAIVEGISLAVPIAVGSPDDDEVLVLSLADGLLGTDFPARAISVGLAWCTTPTGLLPSAEKDQPTIGARGERSQQTRDVARRVAADRGSRAVGVAHAGSTVSVASTEPGRGEGGEAKLARVAA